MIAAVILAGLLGLLIGSFLNVCVYRMPRDISVAKPSRSFCPECESNIAWYDNIPLLSYILLRGKCRKCGWGIPVRYPLLELATAAAFAICVGQLGLTIVALKYAIFSAILIALAASDFENLILPDEFTLGGLLIGLVLAWFVPLETFFGYFLPRDWSNQWRSLAEGAFAAALASASIWLIGFLYEKVRHREGLGLGDVKMIAMIGAFVGLQGALLTLVLASFLGSVLGLIFIKLTKKDAATYELPFGTFISVGALLVAVIVIRRMSV